MSQLPSNTLRRASLPRIASQATQKRHASLIKRPHRPYTFTQLVTLSDGSTYLTRTTSPLPVYKSTKDTRNTVLWQPSLASLRNVEQDEAGRLRAFRQRFGRGWDMEAQEGEEGAEENAQEEDSLMDLISGQSSKGKVEKNGKGAEVDGKSTVPTQSREEKRDKK